MKYVWVQIPGDIFTQAELEWLAPDDPEKQKLIAILSRYWRGNATDLCFNCWGPIVPGEVCDVFKTCKRAGTLLTSLSSEKGNAIRARMLAHKRNSNWDGSPKTNGA